MSKTISLVGNGEILRDGIAQLGAGSAVYLADGETVGVTFTAEADTGGASASTASPFDAETIKHRVTVFPRYGADRITDYGVC